LESNEISAAIEQGKSEAAQKAITMTVSQADGVQKLAAPVQQAAPAEAAPQAAEPVATPEPTKVSKKKEETAEKKDLKDILSDWDDEN
jgi:hypothetical protein